MYHTILLNPYAHPLRRRRPLKGMRHLGLPGEAILAEDLSRDLEVLGALQQAGADDDLVAQDGLVVVDVGGAVGAVVAVDVLAWWGGGGWGVSGGGYWWWKEGREWVEGGGERGMGKGDGVGSPESPL